MYFLNNGKVKFLQIKQDTIRQKCYEKHEAAARILKDPSPPPPPHQLHKYLIDCPFLNQKIYKDIRISYSLKYKHPKK